jgi:hypothetical protein
MAITTSESINQPKTTHCQKCGHPGTGLMRMDANGQIVHERGECPQGVYEVEGPLIAHDPLGGEVVVERGRAHAYVNTGGADRRALERLKALGKGLTRQRSAKPLVAEVQEVAGTPAGYEHMVYLPEDVELDEALPGGFTPAESLENMQPLQSKKRKPSTT